MPSWSYVDSSVRGQLQWLYEVYGIKASDAGDRTRSGRVVIPKDQIEIDECVGL